MSIVSRTPICRWLLATVSALALSSSSLLAQDASGETSAPDDAGVTMLEAIVVQARKRGENPQDVPISMTVVGQDELEKSEIKGTDELIRRAPNLSIADSGIPKTSRFIIRGSGAIGMDSPDDTSVGVYLDGIPIPKQLAEIGFLDVEQVEVLRGPQGTLFGQNSTAGAINILSVEPEDVMSFRLGSEFGTGGHRDVRFSFNAPIVPDTVYGRFSGYYRGQNGWIPDLNLGHKADSAEAWAGRGVIKILPNDQSDITISFDALKSESDNPSFLWKDAPGYPVISRDIPEIAERDTIGLGITANYHFDNFTLTSVTGLRRLDLHTRTDNYDALLYPSFEPFLSDHGERTDTFFQEVRVASPEGSEIQWQAGVNFSALNFEARFNDSMEMMGFPIDELRAPNIKDRSYAAFGEVTLPVRDQFFLTLGGRYTHDHKDISYGYSNSLGMDVVQNASDSWGGFTGRASFGYKPTDDFTTYATIARGWKPGGYNTYSTNIAMGSLEDAYGATSSINYEVGVKKQLLDGRAALQASVFYNDISDEQVGAWDQNTASFQILNADVVSRGAELELSYEVVPGFTVRGGVGYTDARFSKSVALAGIGKDDRVPLVPQWTGNIGFTYDRDITLGTRDAVWSTSVDYSFNSDRVASLGDDFKLPSYGIVNVRTGIEVGNLNAYVFAKNLFDEEYYTVGMNNVIDGRYGVATGQRRVLGLGATYKW